jgi:hypothetical protein
MLWQSADPTEFDRKCLMLCPCSANPSKISQEIKLKRKELKIDNKKQERSRSSSLSIFYGQNYLEFLLKIEKKNEILQVF